MTTDENILWVEGVWKDVGTERLDPDDSAAWDSDFDYVWVYVEKAGKCRPMPMRVEGIRFHVATYREALRVSGIEELPRWWWAGIKSPPNLPE